MLKTAAAPSATIPRIRILVVSPTTNTQAQPEGERKPNSPRGNCQISKSGSGRRKGAGINGLLVSGSAVQFDKVDQHQPVRRLTVVFGLGKSTLVGQRDPRSQHGPHKQRTSGPRKIRSSVKKGLFQH